MEYCDSWIKLQLHLKAGRENNCKSSVLLYLSAPNRSQNRWSRWRASGKKRSCKVMYSYASLLYHLLWQLCRMYWPVSWYFDRGMINFNRSLLSAVTAAHSTAHFFFRNVVGVYIPGIRASWHRDNFFPSLSLSSSFFFFFFSFNLYMGFWERIC